MNKQEKIKQLYQIQVNCLKITKEQFNNMVEVLDNLGLNTLYRESDLEISNAYSFLQVEIDNSFIVFSEELYKETITYEEFMKRFEK